MLADNKQDFIDFALATNVLRFGEFKLRPRHKKSALAA